MQGISAGEAFDRGETVTVQNGHMMVAALDHHEKIERIGLVCGCLGQALRIGQDHPARGDLLGSPDRRLGGRLKDQRGQFVDFDRGETVGKARHLGGRTALGDDLLGLLRLEASEVARQKGRSLTAKPVAAVASGTVLLVERIGTRGPAFCCPQKQGAGQEAGPDGEISQPQPHASFLDRASARRAAAG